MGEGDPRIDRYLAKDRPWRAELLALRALLLSEGLSETLKWRSPCYVAHGGNVAMADGMKDCAVVSFFKGVLLEDPEGLLVSPGPNSRSARFYKATSVAQIEADAEKLRALIRQAVENEGAGRKVDLPADDLSLPEELEAALDADPELAEAWQALTPGRRRGYVVHIGGAKQAATRTARIEKHRPRILAGLGMHDR
ncbi:hypothetical protein OCH239_21275 [Roseivivax halodurans JCM 10272]|uniref:YdhG-like domain-containing protein n=1 Tax=Roseivivax halodurans JCM 10272 TaxID=1449350 RepID=X7EFQ9_9RHOB|nr:YdeI/OmpD-associated family protein [Roseivivax halodurans]ETX14884.1 hypothetical protein OCH239_21275 [Roseivivax halodurans JCM 10272]